MHVFKYKAGLGRNSRQSLQLKLSTSKKLFSAGNTDWARACLKLSS